ncbi:flagellar hook-basal body complex protein FliE [Paradesulfitobacterium ferrireducens]|uniref:flagellar hook-basal body complex protein FliE n=1 Tax=Paradesulfitobacterium ferrireducens TaxID=2816476 RepID=UPI001A8E3834|nr:flagellar hook-basal body complex protein FliE [Paradesulfitobacterium ferrireducens]
MSVNGIMPLLPLPPIGQAVETAAAGNPSGAAGAAKAGVDFSKFLQEAIDQVNALQQNAEAASAGLATGQIQDLHTAIIALEKASLSMSLTVEVRNKVLDAYNEMMRMQI